MLSYWNEPHVFFLDLSLLPASLVCFATVLGHGCWVWPCCSHPWPPTTAGSFLSNSSNDPLHPISQTFNRLNHLQHSGLTRLVSSSLFWLGRSQVAVLTNLCMDMGVQSRTLNCLLRCPCFRRGDLGWAGDFFDLDVRPQDWWYRYTMY